ALLFLRPEFIILFQSHFGLQILQITTQAGHRNELLGLMEEHRGVVVFQGSRDPDPIRTTRVTDIANLQVVMIAPEKRHAVKRRVRPENIARGGLALTLRDYPVFYANATCSRIRPGRNITSGKNSFRIGLKELVNQYAVICRDPSCFSQCDVWTHANP